MLSSKAKRGFTASFLIGLALVSIIVYDRDLKYYKQVFEMLGRDHRRISINLGDWNCEWTAPIRQPPTEIDFHKTLIAGYPSGWVSVCLVLISMIRATTYSSLYWFQWYTHGLDSVRSPCRSTYAKWLRQTLQRLYEFSIYKIELPASSRCLELG